jgi:Enoyl-(Acyl carrier protein) reductase/Transposase DDE domain group 1
VIESRPYERWGAIVEYATGEAKEAPLRPTFDRRIKLQFHGARITSDGGLLAYRELDDAFRLTEIATMQLLDGRRGRNVRHQLGGLFRQSVFGRLAGYGRARPHHGAGQQRRDHGAGGAAIPRAADRDFDRMLAIHVRGTALLSALCVPGMRAAGFGPIINLSSVLGLVGLPFRLGYGVAKTAIIGLTRSLAMENARFGSTVNAIAPGYIATETNVQRAARGLLDFELYAERTPVGRWGRPEEIARVVVFLADLTSAFITGAVFPIDGGYSARGDPGGNLGPRPSSA